MVRGEWGDSCDDWVVGVGLCFRVCSGVGLWDADTDAPSRSVWATFCFVSLSLRIENANLFCSSALHQQFRFKAKKKIVTVHCVFF